MMKNKVLMFSHELPPQGGGAGVVGLQYCCELAEAGFEVTLLTKKKGAYPKTLKNVDIIGVTYIPKLYLIPYYFKLKKINLADYNHIILNDMVSVHVAGFCFSESELNKSISFLHGSEPETVYRSPNIYQKLTCLNYFYSRAIQHVARIISVSHYMKSKFLKETPFKNGEKIKVYHSKLGSDFFPMKPAPLKPRGKEEIDIILTVSRIERGKGFIEMYEVFKKLIELDGKFEWKIVGDGSFKHEFESIVKKDNLENYIHFEGKVERSSLRRYFESANVFWLLSNYKESFGLVYLEAQACYCPAIGYRRYGVIEAINENETGFLVSNAEQSINIFINRDYEKLYENDYSYFLESMHSHKIGGLFNDA
ncbi:glycosyltransferase family 4 protein [Pseudoalteromonas sp. NZS100_1]|uniref:glycosyltransferase family 4 protein n=1 Tax=Pseudoalteromonas sp. NZS100_1 TaxID=2792073 RepID=UPI0018CE35E0|nr:glycosyltransferase family 4 protein [Pseudoalteromonas sp. NZS100_1]MBH0011577.1 glycosyltransferase family 4 protein [Pseudoalteromonas sp. NZS100_1]